MDKDAIRKALTYYEMLIMDQRNRLANLRIQAERGLDTTTTATEFARENEDIYLKLKSLIHEISGENPSNVMEDLGTTESFPSYLEEIESGLWKFHLPPFFSIGSRNRYKNEGKHVYFLVMNLLDKFEEKHGRISKMERPLIIFKHHICTDTSKVFDFDNIDSKRAIDAMQGFFLKDDNAFYLTTLHEAVKDSDESYCDIFVVDRAVRKDADQAINQLEY